VQDAGTPPHDLLEVFRLSLLVYGDGEWAAV
jgi:hypothetical protein